MGGRLSRLAGPLAFAAVLGLTVWLQWMVVARFRIYQAHVFVVAASLALTTALPASVGLAAWASYRAGRALPAAAAAGAARRVAGWAGRLSGAALIALMVVTFAIDYSRGALAVAFREHALVHAGLTAWGALAIQAWRRLGGPAATPQGRRAPGR